MQVRRLKKIARLHKGTFNCKARVPRSPRDITAQTVLPLSAFFPVGMHTGKRGVAFDEEAHDAARTIVETCGEDVDTNRISYIKMHMHVRLERLRCSRAHPRLVMR